MYSISKYSWANKGFEYSAEYSFKDDLICGYRVISQHTGILESPLMIRESPLNFYYHQDCTWLLDSNVERHLTIEIGSSQSRKYKYHIVMKELSIILGNNTNNRFKFKHNNQIFTIVYLVRNYIIWYNYIIKPLYDLVTTT